MNKVIKRFVIKINLDIQPGCANNRVVRTPSGRRRRSPPYSLRSHLAMPLPTKRTNRRPGRRGRLWSPRWESLEDRALLSVATGLGPNAAPDVIGAPYAPGQVLVQFR